jgi:hypothetical protein
LPYHLYLFFFFTAAAPQARKENFDISCGAEGKFWRFHLRAAERKILAISSARRRRRRKIFGDFLYAPQAPTKIFGDFLCAPQAPTENFGDFIYAPQARKESFDICRCCAAGAEGKF